MNHWKKIIIFGFVCLALKFKPLVKAVQNIMVSYSVISNPEEIFLHPHIRGSGSFFGKTVSLLH